MANVAKAVQGSIRNITATHRIAPIKDTQALQYLKAGLHPGDLVMEAWNTEKLIKAQAATKKFDKRVATKSNFPIKIHPNEMQKTKKYPRKGS